MAGRRIASVGSTASTRWPDAANHAASRPVPEPMSSTLARRRRDQMQHRPVSVRGGDAFVAPEELLGLVGISFGAAHLR